MGPRSTRAGSRNYCELWPKGHKYVAHGDENSKSELALLGQTCEITINCGFSCPNMSRTSMEIEVRTWSARSNLRKYYELWPGLCKYVAHGDEISSRNSAFKQGSNMSDDLTSVLRTQFPYSGINFCTGKAISVLGNQILYGESISVLGNQLLCRGINFCTAESMSVLGNQFLYWGINFCTVESISVLGNQLLYRGCDSCTMESISVLGKQFLYWGINFCTGESISVLGN